MNHNPNARSANFFPGDYVTIFADASFCDKTKAMGWAGWCKYDHPAKTVTKFGQGTCENSTVAETIALNKMVNYLISIGLPFENKKVVIQSDCLGALNAFKPRRLLDLGAINVKFKHIKGHSGLRDNRSKVNEWCDRIAYSQMSERRLHTSKGVSWNRF